jgi:hypothetical protein
MINLIFSTFQKYFEAPPQQIKTKVLSYTFFWFSWQLICGVPD